MPLEHATKTDFSTSCSRKVRKYKNNMANTTMVLMSWIVSTSAIKSVQWVDISAKLDEMIQQGERVVKSLQAPQLM